MVTNPGSEDDRCPIHQDGRKIFLYSEQINVVIELFRSISARSSRWQRMPLVSIPEIKDSFYDITVMNAFSRAIFSSDSHS
jgi:hypothetical protein